jgi:hypothetical protein
VCGCPAGNKSCGAKLRDEELIERAHRLRAPQDQIAAIPQGEGKELECALLQLLREVDQHIPAQDQVELREGGMLPQVVLAEDDQAPHLLVDRVSLGTGAEIARD